MQSSKAAPTSPRSTLIRLLIAFILGLSGGSVAFSQEYGRSFYYTFGWWQYALPTSIFALAMLISVLLDPAVRRHTVGLIRVAVSVLLILLIASAVVTLEQLRTFLSLPEETIALLNAVIPFYVGLATAFTVAPGSTRSLAVGSAVLSWFGASLLIVLASSLIHTSQPFPPDEFLLFFLIGGSVFGLGLAALGGILGWPLRRWLLGRAPVASVTAIPPASNGPQSF